MNFSNRKFQSDYIVLHGKRCSKLLNFELELDIYDPVNIVIRSRRASELIYSHLSYAVLVL